LKLSESSWSSFIAKAFSLLTYKNPKRVILGRCRKKFLFNQVISTLDTLPRMTASSKTFFQAVEVINREILLELYLSVSRRRINGAKNIFNMLGNFTKLN
jgi:hypothetical protein